MGVNFPSLDFFFTHDVGVIIPFWASFVRHINPFLSGFMLYLGVFEMLSREPNLNHLGIIDRDIMGTYELLKFQVLGFLGVTSG